MKKKIQIICIGLITLNLQLITHNSFSQNVGINETGSTAFTSAGLDIDYSNKGLLIPRMTQTERDNISPVTAGLLIYQMDNLPGFYYHNGSNWVPLLSNAAGGAAGWDLFGNSGTSSNITASANFIGTTDNQNLRIRTNNIDRLTVTKEGFVGVNGWGWNPLTVSGPQDGSSIFSVRENIVYGDRFHIDINPGTGGIDIETEAGPLNIINSYAVNGSQDDIRFFTTLDNTTTPLERMRISENGNVGVGTTGPGYLFQVGNAGDGSEARANAWNNLSDKRLKTNVVPILNALEKVEELEGVYFDWKSTGEKSLGFIAQDVEKILPELVSKGDTDDYLAMQYGNITAVLVEAIKEQQKIINNQKAQIGNQQNEMEDLRSTVLQMKKKDNQMELKLKQLEEHLKTANK